MTVGETLTLTCAINAGDTSNVEWKNPSGFVMFFNHNKGQKRFNYVYGRICAVYTYMQYHTVQYQDVTWSMFESVFHWDAI